MEQFSPISEGVNEVQVIEEEDTSSHEHTETISKTVGASTTCENEQKRTRSEVWKLLVPYTTNDGKMRAKCKCGKTYAADTKNSGTSNMKKHMLTCKKRKITDDLSQMMVTQVFKLQSRKFDQSVFCEKLSKELVQHDCPFSYVEYKGFRELLNYLNPEVKHVSRNTAKADMLKFYKEEKNRLKEVLQCLEGRICLTSDLWTSIAGNGYISITVHFVDSFWKLQSKIIQFSHLPPPHTGYALCEMMMKYLKEWGIEKKVFSLTLDNASANDVLQQCMRRQMKFDNSLLCDGKHFHVRCCAHILNLIVQDGLKVIDSGLQKIRDSVRYVRASESRRQIFDKCIEHMQIQSSVGLQFDVSTRWNSTYAMLESAILYRKTFDHFEMVEDGYKSNLSMEEWERAERMASFLKPFSNVTTLFSSREYVTSNLYFLYVWKIQLKLMSETNSQDEVIRQMATRMKKKFDKYWEDYTNVLSFALALDPRFKLGFIGFCFNKLNSTTTKDKLDRVTKEVHELYDEYVKILPSCSETIGIVGSVNSSTMTNLDIDDDYYEFAQHTQGTMSELDVYLEETRYNPQQYPDFDVLDFWKSQKSRAPIFSTMARDIMSIPITTVASESAFSMGSRLLTKYRSSMLPTNVDALICMQNWIDGYEVHELANEEDLEDHFG